MKLPKYTLGIGDRFAHQGEAQLSAILEARKAGLEVHPVWNKSNREHSIVKSHPRDLRAEADAAVAALAWDAPYFVDADHIGLKTVDAFLESSNFYTIDVADFVGQPASLDAIGTFEKTLSRFGGEVRVPGLAHPLILDGASIRATADKFLSAIGEAGRVYRHIHKALGDHFVTEVSIDETDAPQTPLELFLILAMIAAEGIPAQTVAPKFTGRFNKGVDYRGDLARFEKEFDEDLAILSYAIREFGMPESLKLSVHSGSDKFSLYPIINRLIKKHNSGLHLKTAGTTWLEEVIGLAESGGDGLALAKEIYVGALDRFDELTAPYAPVIDIDPARLPSASTVANWSSEDFVGALRHDQTNPAYNCDLRQLVHVAFKLAAEADERYTRALVQFRPTIARNVTENLLHRHILPVFGS